MKSNAKIVINTRWDWMKKMNEDKKQKLQGIIDKLIDTKDFIYIGEVNSKSHGTKTSFKLGLYYLYDANDKIIYWESGKCRPNKFLFQNDWARKWGAYKTRVV